MKSNKTSKAVFYWIGKLNTPKRLQWKMMTNFKKRPLTSRDYVEAGKNYCRLRGEYE